jgi:hypothetical protein
MANLRVRESQIKMQVVPDPDHDGEEEAVGVRAVAVLEIPFGKDFIRTKISSPGLWGIEGGDNKYYREIFEEEKATLIDMLDGLTVKVVP